MTNDDIETIRHQLDEAAQACATEFNRFAQAYATAAQRFVEEANETLRPFVEEFRRWAEQIESTRR